jgi:anhydro-N-acetylmuramic acid kinase
MNPYLTQLQLISEKQCRLVVGLMSGTSLDGLDVALCEITGHGRNTEITLKAFESVPYESLFVNKIRSVFSKKNIDLEKLTLLHSQIAKVHAGIVNQCLSGWKINKTAIDLLASHGQTIYHAPYHQHLQQGYGNATLQIGDGDQLALHTGIITISDFRQKHIAAGGEGAPLAVYGDFLLYTHQEENRILLNIGGIANFTFLPAGKHFENIVCSDTGPGNTLMDAWVCSHFQTYTYDADAHFAKQGRINEALLNVLLLDDYFSLMFPKSTGPEYFNLDWLNKIITINNLSKLSPFDVLATLTTFTARSIAKQIDALGFVPNCKVMVSGGGIHNPMLLEQLQLALPHINISILPNADAKEAILFALLANEMIAGDNNAFGNGAKGFPAVGMGKISFPG